ncbi:hypothetical protein Desor_3527 [Desulfosporosinus orientis DSM 765]|uniref:Uncharacterized protein n=1 Tax=Desulfosporosinus orientis (strain ATCC 19365 / DSM 765 / NCIMB 8382 / VKM B-1628 / Singapore I) TaxID=768706 RepID=G7WGZ6_DESOD|nr:membrane protein [Desulfosporosinus orientis]AET69010.1 hypothetical protein Desor_3527 [Desulfosporosinus orientis DSM 765]
MEHFFLGLGLKTIIIGGLGILALGFILKKLFKLALTIAVILIVVYYGLPMIQTVISR